MNDVRHKFTLSVPARNVTITARDEDELTQKIYAFFRISIFRQRDGWRAKWREAEHAEKCDQDFATLDEALAWLAARPKNCRAYGDGKQ